MLELDLSTFPILRTERLLLRELRTGDAEVIFALRSDPEVMRYVSRPLAASITEADEFIRNAHEGRANNDAVVWGITLHGDDRLIGTVAFWRVMKEHHRAEIGYTLLPAHWGKGIVSEALAAILDHGFGVLKFHSVEANTDPDNSASRRVLEKAGFVQEAHFKENWFFNGVFTDSVIYSKLAPKQ
jgi:ribosomal-protein-alanine N-acetyltransferase